MTAASGPGDAPAARAAEELLAVVRADDEERMREFIETRFAPELRDRVPMSEHLQMFSFFRADLEGREVAGVELDGPTRVALLLRSPRNRLRMRLQVEPEPPHRITGLNVADAGPEIRATSLADLDSELERLAAGDEFSGVVLVASGGEVRFLRAYGLADRASGRANRPETRFDIGSLTKLFTSTAILRLAQEGRLALDDPLGKYLDGFQPEVAEKVTLRQLLQHRSGFGDYLGHPEFRADPKRFDEPADFLPLARAQELEFEPGTGTRYSNLGFVLLGAVIERVTGRGYHEVVEEFVFRPARMVSAGPSGGPEAARRYARERGQFVSTDPRYPDLNSPAGGGFAAALDLQRFVEALLDHRLLDERHTALLLNGFEPPADGGTLPERFAYVGGAPGVNAAVNVRRPARQIVVVLANLSPFAVSSFAQEVERLLR